MAKTRFASKEIEREDGPSKGDELANDINRVVSDILTTLKSSGPPLSSECCIYRVPNVLRRVNEAAYTPQLVSIGPLHHGKKTLKRMEKYKLWYLKKFLKRAEKRARLHDFVSIIQRSESSIRSCYAETSAEESARLHDFVSAIKRLESSIRSCYAETSDDLHSDKFVKMILMDAAFIFEHFLWFNLIDPNDFPFFNLRLHNDISNDLILLENQLPFFVLEELYNLAFPLNNLSFRELTLNSFSHYNKQLIKSIPQEIKHFTDLLRYFLLPTPQTHRATEQNDIINHLYSATELHDAGVKFKVSSSNCLLDIKFNKGVLTIPCLELYDDTESYIRNLIALEQCHYPLDTYICNYISIMDHLINTAKDVDLLIQKKIIVHWLGNQGPVATLFNKLCTHIVRENDKRYIDLCKGLNAHYEVRRNRWKATLRHEYFSTPWRIASIIAAFILLVLTLIQTICAIISM